MDEKEFWKEVARTFKDKTFENFDKIEWDQTWTMERVEEKDCDDFFYSSEKK